MNSDTKQRKERSEVIANRIIEIKQVIAHLEEKPDEYRNMAIEHLHQAIFWLRRARIRVDK